MMSLRPSLCVYYEWQFLFADNEVMVRDSICNNKRV